MNKQKEEEKFEISKTNQTGQREICVFCVKPFDGYGNNPSPVLNFGLACDKCNITRVIPARLNMRK
jgi:hypothetical protein